MKTWIRPAVLLGAAGVVAALLPVYASTPSASSTAASPTRWTGEAGITGGACQPLDPTCDHFAYTVPAGSDPIGQVVSVRVAKLRATEAGAQCDRDFQVVVYRLRDDGPMLAIGTGAGQTQIVGAPASAAAVSSTPVGGALTFPAQPGSYIVEIARPAASTTLIDTVQGPNDYDAAAGVAYGPVSWGLC